MNFIIPQNYNFKPKLLGILDYPTAILNVAIIVILIIVLNLCHFVLVVKCILFIIVYLPIFLISVFGFYNENFLLVFLYVFKYLISPKVYIYK